MNKIEKRKNFDGDTTGIIEMKAWVSNQLRKCSVSNKLANSFDLALEEILPAIYKHAYINEKVKPMRLKIRVTSERVSVSLRDLGHHFDFIKVESINALEAVFSITVNDMLSHMMDGVEFLPHKIGKEIVIWKGQR